MFRQMLNGFCMALADSVPGVSGGTVAFIMGFYDQLIGAIHQLVFGKKNDKRHALQYLGTLGCGWIIGMISAVIALSSLFEYHIYTISSLFIGFIAGAIPLIVLEEQESVRSFFKGISFLVIGIFLVVGITWFNGRTGQNQFDLSQISISSAIKLFFIGMISISAMFLPGISGSTLLLIFGAYIPVVMAVKGLLTFNLAYLPSLLCFGMGILTGALSIVKIIKICLEKYRPQTIYLIIGMMIGSFYAIVMGPTTLAHPKEALSMEQVNFIAILIALLLVLGLQKMKTYGKRV